MGASSARADLQGPTGTKRRKGNPSATPVPTAEVQMTSVISCLAPKLPNFAPFQTLL